MSLAIRFIRRVELGFTGDEDSTGNLVELDGVLALILPAQEGGVVVDGHGLVRGEGDEDGASRLHLDHPVSEGVCYWLLHIISVFLRLKRLRTI